MAKSNDIYALAAAALSGNRKGVETACKVITSKERDSSTLKRQIDRLLERSSSKFSMDGNTLPMDLRGLVLHVEPAKSVSDIVLSADIESKLSQFMKERRNIDALHSFNLPASNKLLLSGPPGNGKTSLAGAIANELGLPFFVLDFSAVISSHLGETGSKIAKAFRNASNMPCVLFIDEMETVLSERAGQNNKQDVGEVARIVSTLLQEIDRMSDQVVLIGATNHVEMLDRAVVRRFDYHWLLDLPSDDVKSKWIASCAARYPEIPLLTFDINTDGLSISDLERVVLARCKQWALESIAA
ncbi:AAA family ATPase [Photobacterium damselae]|uniref:AAA family ATPase n=1 Tax=Photobacterium damselae TaxID=38293 RepID=UPI004067CEEC